MTSDNIFIQFCKYVDGTIFSEEKKGEVVAFIVDQTYINDFCKIYHAEEKELLIGARTYLHCVTTNSLYVRGMIAIQVYAATKRANRDGFTDRNYNDRLAQLLFYDDTGELQRWYSNYQDVMWRMFYAWCDSNNFQVSKKCYPYYDKGRYVQYPLQEARRVFTTEALLNFARAFADHKLTPEDDFSYKTFWELISWRELERYVVGKNAKRIYNDSEYRSDAKQQIYNFFLCWDGEYRISNYSEKLRRVVSDGNRLYLSQKFDCAEVRDVDYKLVASYPIVSLKYDMLTNDENHLAIRKQGVFLFKFDKDYQIWEETHFIEAGEEGIAMVFQNSTLLASEFRNCELLKQCPCVKLYKITENTAPDFCFTERRTCYLEGGLKVGRNMYLVDGAPFLVRENFEIVRVDTKPISSNEKKINLNYLKSGTHVVSIPGRKSIKFELVEPQMVNMEWSPKFTQWVIAKRDILWQSSREDGNVSGMDFRNICKTKDMDENEFSSSRQWAKCFIEESVSTSNAAIKTLKNIRDYEVL